MKPQVISFHCVLKTKLGRLISSTVAHDVVTATNGGSEPMLVGLVEGLQDLKGGERREIFVPAERAYGFYDPAKVLVVSRDEISESVALGKQVQVQYRGKSVDFRVTELRGEDVVLDANHPLAGEDLVFQIEALDVRDAEPDELATDSGTFSKDLH